ncbi:MAG: hypothetical protein JWN04_2975, partial [Myxococcaceae bacterium]|nr:hypothetical protein [Myxococcaceae bacterium]
MQPVSEAKQFVALHARHMGMRPSYLAAVLDSI